MANGMPMPSPPLDGVPPSPPSVQAGPAPSLSGLAPQAPDMGGGMQVIQLGLQIAADIMRGLDMLGQVFQGFAPLSAALQQQLRGGLKAAIQQGAQGSEPSLATPSYGMGLMQSAQNPGDVPVQQPLPMLPSGM